MLKAVTATFSVTIRSAGATGSLISSVDNMVGILSAKPNSAKIIAGTASSGVA
jgi:hypothetical protein